MHQPINLAITGASGFVGQHLLEDIDAEKYQIRVITRNAGKKMPMLPLGNEIVEADLSNFETLNKAFRGIDILINCAAEVQNPTMLAETNISGTKNLIKAAIENKISKIIHLSSVGVVGMHYSNAPMIIDEEAACAPQNEYERTKLEAERLLLEARKQNKFLLTILRPTNVFGEQHPFNALLHLINRIRSGKAIVYGGSARVNYVYVKDLTNVIVKIISGEKEYGIINVGDSQDLSYFVKTIALKLGIKENLFLAPQFLFNFSEKLGVKKLRSVSNQVIYQDDKLKTFFKYPYGVNDGLLRTIEYYKKQNLLI